MRINFHHILRLWMLPALFLVTGCQTAQYAMLEKVGVEKRDIFTSRMKAAQKAQTDAKDQFEDALDAFRSVVNFDGGDLDSAYSKLKSQYERSSAKAANVSDRIDSVERVSGDMFKEWRGEIDQFKSESLRRSSRQKYDDKIRKYDQLMAKMRSAEASMQPVLGAFRDRVLFLKHHLNAEAISALRGELSEIEMDVGSLIADMSEAIEEADAFIQGY